MRGIAAFASSVVLLDLVISPLAAEDARCTTRTILATVIDRQRNVVGGLTPAHFRGKFRGKPVQILSVTPDKRHRRIVIVVDASRSMGGERGMWTLVTDLAADTFRLAPPNCSFALLVFSDTIKEWVGFNQSTTILAKKLATLQMEPNRAVGKTALYDALTAALVELSPPHQGDTMYVITDGGDNASKTGRSELETALVTSGVRLFAFMPLTHFDLLRSRALQEATGPSAMLDLAQVTGGNVFSHTSPTTWFIPSEKERRQQMRFALGRLYNQMGRQDRLEIRLAAPVDKPRGWKLEIVDENGKPNRELEVLYPRKLMPCSS